MQKIFLFGSISLKTIPAKALTRLDQAILSGKFSFIIGDADGMDVSLQKHLVAFHCENVNVFHSSFKMRHFEGEALGWKKTFISVPDGYYGRAWHQVKDRAMAQAADFGFGIWDGRSPGSKANFMELKNQGKFCLLWDNSQGCFIDNGCFSKKEEESPEPSGC